MVDDSSTRTCVRIGALTRKAGLRIVAQSGTPVRASELKGEIKHDLWRVCRDEITVQGPRRTGGLPRLRGPVDAGFEENWLKPRLKARGYSHVRFFGGTTFEYDGSFRERVCELARQESIKAEFFVYG